VAQVRFLAVGELMLDIVASGRGHAAEIRVAPGGSAALAAGWAARAGARAAVVGRLGDDLAGRVLSGALREAGVEALLSVDRQAPTGTYLLVDGEARVVRGANASLLPPLLPPRLEADAVLVSGYLPPETVEAALARARAAWVALAPATLTQLPAGANALLLDEEEARRLTGRGAREAARLLGERARLVAVTRGPLGAVAVLDGREDAIRGSGRPLGSPIGAGDAFAAGLLVSLASGAGLGEALQVASRLGQKAAASGSWPAG
jgi:ribokinase